MKLLTVQNAKTVKGESEGYMTGILYLAPADIANRKTVCALAGLANCKSACLYTAGRGAYSNVQTARIRKTEWYHADRAGFIATLSDDIGKLERKAERKGLTPVVRLNGTSDIPWERFAPELFERYSHITFYDYTKLPSRLNLPGNYSLTWSYSGANERYAAMMDDAVRAGMNVATVFRKVLPDTWRGMPVINGDETDLRFLDPKGVVVGLKAKGAAKRDRSGFVVDAQ